MHDRWRAAPLALKGFLVFAVVASSIEIGILLLSPGLRGLIVYHLGWLPTAAYLFSLYFACTWIARGNSRAYRAIVTFLLIHMAHGALDMAITREAASSIPFLSSSAVRWVWALVIPALWILALSSRAVREYRWGGGAER